MDASSFDRRQRAPYEQSPYPTRPPPNPPASFYPKITSTGAAPINRAPPPVPIGAIPGADGVSIKVALKPEYRVQPPAQLSPLTGEVPRTTFQYDFDFERRVIAEADKGWVREHPRQANGSADTPPPATKMEDPVIAKYVSMGLNKEAVVLALTSYGDVQNKVLEFCPAYSLLREMGFPSEAVAAALVMYDNDKERALAHFV